MVESFEGVTLLNYITARAEGFAYLKVQLLEEKYTRPDDIQSNVSKLMPTLYLRRNEGPTD